MIRIWKKFRCLAWVAMVVGCSVSPDMEHKADQGNGMKSLVVKDSTVVVGGDATGVDLLSSKSFTLFEQHVHPLLKQNCGSCHSTTTKPFFAADDHVVSLQALVDAKKVDPAAPERSRLVERLASDLHNCWGECPANADEMKGVLTAWLDALGPATGGATSLAFTTQSSPLTSLVTVKTGLAVDSKILVFEAESGTVSAPFSEVVDQGVSEGRYLTSSSGGVPEGDLAGQHIANNSLGVVTYTFRLEGSGNYEIFGRVRDGENGENTFFYKIDSQEERTWQFDSNSNFNWDQLSQQENGVGNMTFFFEAGDHTLRIRQAELGAAIDKIIISGSILDDDLNLYETSPLNGPHLSYSLQEVLGVEAQLTVQLRIGSGAYELSRPTIVNPTRAQIHAKGLFPIINGSQRNEDVTFSQVAIDSSEAMIPLSDAAMTMVADKGVSEDQLSFGFQELGVK